MFFTHTLSTKYFEINVEHQKKKENSYSPFVHKLVEEEKQEMFIKQKIKYIPNIKFILVTISIFLLQEYPNPNYTDTFQPFK